MRKIILDQAKHSPVKNSLQKNSLQLEVKALNNDAEVFSKALEKSLTQKIIRAKKVIKRQKILSLAMLLTGIAILLFGYFFKTVELMYEVALVASWVFLWRAVELYFFDRQYNRLSILLYKRALAAEIKPLNSEITPPM